VITKILSLDRFANY